MDFWKVNGAGNDFIIIDTRESGIAVERLPALAAAVCRRRLSLGADGLMAVLPPEGDGDFRMLYYNADGSLGEMCGNGARCICRYGYETGLCGDVQRVETTAGLVTGYRLDERTYRIRLNDPSHIEAHHLLQVAEVSYDCAYIELGQPGIPHLVVPMARIRETPTEQDRELARTLRYHPDFPRGANVNFYEVLEKDRISLHTYERGVEDFTYACGTGAGSTVLALTLRGELSIGADVEVRGGTLRVDVEVDRNQVRNLWLTGPAEVIAKGAFTEEALPH